MRLKPYCEVLLKSEGAHQAGVRSKPYRREQGADERGILYFRYRRAEFYLLELRRLRVNFCTGQTARILGALNFRLPRRMNFGSPARLNLKRALFCDQI